jgi:hypothetical protein
LERVGLLIMDNLQLKINSIREKYKPSYYKQQENIDYNTKMITMKVQLIYKNYKSIGEASEFYLSDDIDEGDLPGVKTRCLKKALLKACIELDNLITKPKYTKPYQKNYVKGSRNLRS